MSSNKKIEPLLLISVAFFLLSLLSGLCVYFFLIKPGIIYDIDFYRRYNKILLLDMGIFNPQLYWISLILYFIGLLRVKVRKRTRDIGNVMTYIYLFIISMFSSIFYIQYALIPILFRILIHVHFDRKEGALAQQKAEQE
jgi:hypothetical protein